MTAPVPGVPHGSADDSAVSGALHAIADGLTARGFDLRGPAWEESQQLAITNVRGAVCELTVTTSGRLTWEYRPCRGTHIDPAHIVDMVLTILDAGDRAENEAAPARYPGLTLKGMVGRALGERGMAVRLELLCQDDVNYDVYAEIEVANPAKPGRGTVRVADDGTVEWACSLRGPASVAEGLQPDDVAGTIAKALAGQDI